MGKPVLLEAIQEWLRDAVQLRFPHHHDALKVLVHAAWLDVGSNGDVGEVARASVGVNTVEAAVEEVVEALMDAVCLTHDYCVTFSR